jgi:hypothetical protein
MQDGPQMAGTTPRGGRQGYGSNEDGMSPRMSQHDQSEDSDADSGSDKSHSRMPQYGTKMEGMEPRPSGGGGDHAAGSEDEGKSGGGGIKMSGYNPADFDNLPVSDEIRELFQYIGR